MLCRLYTGGDIDEWGGAQTWGFQLVSSQKKYVRRIHCVGQKGEVVHGCMVYDYGESLGAGLQNTN